MKLSNSLFRKGLVCVVIVLFISLSIVPGISGSTNTISKVVYKDRLDNIHGFVHDNRGYIINNDYFVTNLENEADNNGYGDINPLWVSNQNYREYYKSIQVYNDYLYATGFFYNSETEGYCAIIGKYNVSDGSQIWMKTWSSHHPDTRVWSIDVYNDAIYIIGESGDIEFIVEWIDAFICKFDLDGNLLWSKVINENTFDVFYSIKGYDNSLYICGCKDELLSMNAWILKFDTNGSKIWDKSYKIVGNWLCELLDLEIYDGYIYTEGQVNSFDNTAQDVIVLKVSLNGELIWSREWGGFGPQLGSRIDVYNNYLYICGYGRDDNTYWGGRDLLFKYDLQGNLIWDTSSLCTPANSVDVLCYNGAIYTVGEIWRGYENGYDMILLKFNEDSELIWYLTYGPYGYADGVCFDVYQDFLYLSGDIDAVGFLMKSNPNPFPDNIKPNTPSMPIGETNGRINQLYTYSSVSSDPDGDLLSYSFLWDDGNATIVEWVNSNETISTSYSWGRKGSYNIKVRARDKYGLVSDWSEPLPVIMSRKRQMTNSLFMKFFERFPNTFPIIRQILRL